MERLPEMLGMNTSRTTVDLLRDHVPHFVKKKRGTAPKISILQEKLEVVRDLSFRRVLYVVCFILGISPASEV